MGHSLAIQKGRGNEEEAAGLEPHLLSLPWRGRQLAILIPSPTGPSLYFLKIWNKPSCSLSLQMQWGFDPKPKVRSPEFDSLGWDPTSSTFQLCDLESVTAPREVGI